MYIMYMICIYVYRCMYIDNYMFNMFLQILYTYRTISYHWYKRATMFCMVIQDFKGWLCEKCVFQCVAFVIELDDGKNLQESPIFDGKNHGFL